MFFYSFPWLAIGSYSPGEPQYHNQWGSAGFAYVGTAHKYVAQLMLLTATRLKL